MLRQTAPADRYDGSAAVRGRPPVAIGVVSAVGGWQVEIGAVSVDRAGLAVVTGQDHRFCRARKPPVHVRDDPGELGPADRLADVIVDSDDRFRVLGRQQGSEIVAPIKPLAKTAAASAPCGPAPGRG